MNLKNIADSLQNYFSLSDFLIPQSEAEVAIRDGVTFRGTNMVILVLAILIASLGLNTNSTAVIIGAMLISPLMGPIIGLGLAVGIEDYELLKRSGRNLGMATLFSIAASTIFFLISPVAEGHSELLARTSPTIYDVLIGFFGGGAGIVALCSRSKGNVIPGVAIATALMPPLCTVGYGVATMQPHYFIGALYLFLINSVFIAISTFIGVKLMRYKTVKSSNPARAKKVRRWVYAVAILTILPSIYLTYNMIRENNFVLHVNKFVNAECRWKQTRVINIDTEWHSHAISDISLTLFGKTMDADSLTQALSSRLKYYGLNNAQISILQGESAYNLDPSAKSTDIYDVSQQMISHRQNEIDSLKQIISMRDFSVPADVLFQEVKAAFPMVRELSMSRNIFTGQDSARITNDTVNIALISTSPQISKAERERLAAFLRLRLDLKSVEVVNLR